MKNITKIANKLNLMGFWLVLITAISFTQSTDVFSQKKISASDIAGKWYGDDQKEYEFQALPKDEITMLVNGEDKKYPPFVNPNADKGIKVELYGTELQRGLTYKGIFNAEGFQVNARLKSLSNFHSGALTAGQLATLLSQYPNFSSRVQIEPVDKNTIRLTRQLTSFNFKSGKLEKAVENYKTETAILTRIPDGNVSNSQPSTTDNKSEKYVRKVTRRNGLYPETHYVKAGKNDRDAVFAANELDRIEKLIEDFQITINDPKFDENTIKVLKRELKVLRANQAEINNVINPGVLPKPNKQNGDNARVKFVCRKVLRNKTKFSVHYVKARRDEKCAKPAKQELAKINRTIRNRVQRINNPETSASQLGFEKRKLAENRRHRNEIIQALKR